jgi:hypothetical protein
MAMVVIEGKGGSNAPPCMYFATLATREGKNMWISFSKKLF